MGWCNVQHKIDVIYINKYHMFLLSEFIHAIYNNKVIQLIDESIKI